MFWQPSNSILKILCIPNMEFSTWFLFLSLSGFSMADWHSKVDRGVLWHIVCMSQQDRGLFVNWKVWCKHPKSTWGPCSDVPVCAIFFICISTDLPPEYSSIFSEMLRQHNCNTMDHNNNSFSLSVSDHYNLHCIYLSIGNWKKYCHIKYKDLSFIFSYNMSNKLWLIIIMANK